MFAEGGIIDSHFSVLVNFYNVKKKGGNYFMKKLMKMLVTSFAIMFMLGISGITANAQSVNESEPNDSMETAQTISANRETASGCVNGSYTGQYVVNGTTSINDSDWYKVYLSAGTQYVTCNGSAFEFYIYDSNGNLFDWATYNKPGFGASAYEFTASSAGYYYVEVIGLSSSSVSYKLAVGGPTYTVDDVALPLGSIPLEGYDYSIRLPMDDINFPEGAIVYTVSISGVSSTATNGVTIINRGSGTTISMTASNLTRTGLVYSNIPLQATWDITFKYKKVTTISPKIIFYYVYPITS